MIDLRAVLAFLLVLGVWGLPQEASAAKEKKPKVSELLKDANDWMSQAQTAYVDGQTKEAIELYRKALAEIARVERENASQAASSEFAPVRFRKALCETEIDRIMLEEVNATARTVAVTDTRSLETKREERKKAAETNNTPEVAVKLGAKQGLGKEDAAEGEKAVAQNDAAEPKAKAEAKRGAEAGQAVQVGEELEWAKDMLSVDRFADADKALMLVLKQQPDHREARFLMAVLRLRQGRGADAAVVLEDLLEEQPNDAAALLLASGCYVSTGAYSKAMDALDRVMKADPKRPDGYHNMAWLLLEMNPKELSQAELYYRQAVKLGGARERELERRLGIKSN